MKKLLGLALLLLLATCRDSGTGPSVPATAVTLNPSHRTLIATQSEQLIATARDRRGAPIDNATVQWSSSDPTRAQVSGVGVVSTRAAGFVTITATSGSASGISTVNILPAAAAVTIAPDTVTLALVDSLQFDATVLDATGTPLGGRAVQWSSSDTVVLSIAPTGLAKARFSGRAIVSAQVEGARGTASVRVWCSRLAHIETSPDSVAISLGEQLQLAATAIDASCNQDSSVFAWSSLDPLRATVTPGGIVIAVGLGTARIVAHGVGTAVAELSDTAIVTIDPPVASVTVVPASFAATAFAYQFPQVVVLDNQGTALRGHPVTWSSSDPGVARFLHDTMITGGIGIATLTASTGGRTGTGTVSVNGDMAPSLPPVVQVLSTTSRPVDIGGIFGLPISLSSTDTAVFTVTPTDTVANGFTTVLLHGKAPGTAALSVTVQGGNTTLGRVETYTVQVQRVVLSPRPYVLRVGDSVTLRADVFYPTGVPQAYPVQWTSVDPNVASVTDSGLVIALQPGRSVITATSGGVSDTVTIYVPAANAPQLIALVTEPLVAGTSFTIQGVNFSAVADSNRVTIGATMATVTASSSTSLTVAIPPADLFPCIPTGPAPLRIQVGDQAAETTAVLQVATQRPLANGDTLRLSGVAMQCNEFPDGVYLATFANGETSFGSPVSFRVATSAIGVVPVQSRWPKPLRAPISATRRGLAWAREARQADRRWVSANREFIRRVGPARSAIAANGAQAGTGSMDAPFRTIRVPILDADGICSHYTEVTTRAAYVGRAVQVLEDINAPLAGTLDPLLAVIGAEFDSNMTLLEQNLGSPLAPSGSGQVLLVFSPAVNEFGTATFVAVCDLFPTSVAPSSNGAPVVYAMTPDTGTGFDDGITKDVWRWLIRGFVMHSSAHLAMYAERISRTLPPEAPWLDEALAGIAEELWARRIYRAAWKSNVDYRQSLYCDVRPTFPECGGRPFAMFDVFASLYEFEETIESWSVLGPTSPGDFLFPGAGWSLLRWAIDQYATSEPTFLKALVNETGATGTDNLELRTGVPFPVMLADWTMASGLDDAQLPGVPDRFQFPSWQLQDVFLGMYLDFNGTFSRPDPLPVRSTGYAAVSEVVTLRPGGVSFWQPWIPGGSGKRFLSVFTPGGTPLPPSFSVEIFRE